jgi:YidC/Oxa1 family membrane protein insertase
LFTLFHSMASLLVPVLTAFYHVVQDWGLAVILFTLVVRAFLLPLNIRTARGQLQQIKMRPELQKVRETYGGNAEKLGKETMALYQKYKVKPFAMFGTMLIQMPVFSAVYFLFLTHGEMMTSFLIPWVPSFAHADSFHLLPLLSAGLTFISSLLPLTTELASNGPFIKRSLPGLIMLPVILLFMWRAPVAVALYWVTGSLFSLCERMFYRTRWGKRILEAA